MDITIVRRDGKANYEIKKLYKNFTVKKSGDIYIALGGDGTFIKAAQMTEKPVLLIRDEKGGSIGYHSDLNIDDLDSIIKRLKKKEYYVEALSNKIEVIYKGRHYFGINEVRLNNIFEEVSFKIYERIGKRKIRIYPFVMSGDGMIATSRIGSTAYNKSAGGPIILSPDVLCLTFLNIDGPYNNPIILDRDREIEVEIVKYNGILGFDNIRIGEVKKGDSFRVRLSEKKINVIRFKGEKESFADKLERRIRSRLVKDFKD
jgi:NAD+ kinase